MKNLFKLLIPAIFLSVSCNRDEVSVANVMIIPTADPYFFMLVDDAWQFTAILEPAGVTNRNTNWASTNTSVVSVIDGMVTALSAGTANVTVTTEDGNHTATSAVSVVSGSIYRCNLDTQGWGETLGVVSFYTDNEWLIEGNGITQIWSDAVTATACQKAYFDGQVRFYAHFTRYWVMDIFNADCRSNPHFPGDLFSWCAVVRFADVLCPYPWRVPSKQDFIDLDIALGGTGNNRQWDPNVNINWMHRNYIDRWGGAFGGSIASDGWLNGGRGVYWSLTECNASSGFSLLFGRWFNIWGQLNHYRIEPQSSQSKSQGHTLRCVR